MRGESGKVIRKWDNKEW